MPVTIKATRLCISMNRNGDLLLVVFHWGTASGGKIRWRRRYQRIDDLDLLPLAIGESMVYCGVRNHPDDGYDLAAFDLKSGKKLYRSSALASSWLRGYEAIQTENTWRRSHNQYAKVIRTDQGEELLLQLSGRSGVLPRTWAMSGIQIIRGSNGHLIQTIECPKSPVENLIYYPLTNQGVLVLEAILPMTFWDQHEQMSRYRIFLMRYYHSQTDGSYALEYTDVLLVDDKDPDRLNHGPHLSILVSPFQQVALLAPVQSDPGPDQCAPLPFMTSPPRS
ncbi:hypothetical protein P175DRAFT_0549094 [Aspergillus ochraceoroseus IBT 24754]|uniref:Uncharacterized protein n=1 Tax=Aspergillus ochraceoroseus IBT 24754 TaxID=1392256 RepID=A0A2T5LS13_9EURO|nr:uncharacterized protein P175DRAFT_0549094 [Aspergillus ochraceoroseus IBT 24754]PTU19073.1 hypothetical protein P175DRAFT_0549094 [Aspergillus ochraceoroseus IBT 24754]